MSEGHQSTRPCHASLRLAGRLLAQLAARPGPGRPFGPFYLVTNILNLLALILKYNINNIYIIYNFIIKIILHAPLCAILALLLKVAAAMAHGPTGPFSGNNSCAIIYNINTDPAASCNPTGLTGRNGPYGPVTAATLAKASCQPA